VGDFHISPEIKSFLIFPKFCDLFIIIDWSFACELLGGARWLDEPLGQNIGGEGLEPLGPHEVGAYDSAPPLPMFPLEEG